MKMSLANAYAMKRRSKNKPVGGEIDTAVLPKRMTSEEHDDFLSNDASDAAGVDEAMEGYDEVDNRTGPEVPSVAEIVKAMRLKRMK